MGASREVIASVCNVKTDDVQCAKCERCSGEKAHWCEFWKAWTQAGAYCSLWTGRNDNGES